jgi:hypothetical protein
MKLTKTFFLAELGGRGRELKKQDNGALILKAQWGFLSKSMM